VSGGKAVRFKGIFSAIRFIEAVLLVAAIVTLFGLSDRKIPIGLLTFSLMLNLTDRVLISQSSQKKDRILQHQEKQLKSILTDAEERRSLQGQDDPSAEVVQQPTLAEFESRIVQIESRNEQLRKQQTLFADHQVVQDNIQKIQEKLLETEGILKELIQKSQSKESINQLIKLIKDIRTHDYELVWDMEASHEVLIEALENFQYRLILVNPWLSEYVFTRTMKRNLENALSKPNTRIFIGWGFWGDIYDIKSFSDKTKVEFDRFDFKKMSDEKSSDPRRVEWKYKALNWLSDLEKQSSGKLVLKLLYTHQKYLVCDNKFAMIGSHNFLASKPADNERGRSPDAEVGIRTTDPALIKEMVNKFGEARNWDLYTHPQ
jgi:hypothetical protein